MSYDPTLHREPEKRILERRRDALMDSLAVVPHDEVTAKFSAFFGAGSGAWSEWDERFMEFVGRHRDAPLLAGKAGDEFFVVFSPSGRAGFWIFAQPGGGHGKGFFNRRDMEKLIALAAQKGLSP